MTGHPPSTSAVRRATDADVPDLLRLREVMLTSVGEPTGGPDALWRQNAAAWFADRLREPTLFAAFVVEDDFRVLSCAVGVVESRIPGRANPAGTFGSIYNVATEARFRGRGHGRACLQALLRWFERETDVLTITLTASPDGQRLYEQYGFRLSTYPLMRLKLRRTDSRG